MLAYLRFKRLTVESSDVERLACGERSSQFVASRLPRLEGIQQRREFATGCDSVRQTFEFALDGRQFLLEFIDVVSQASPAHRFHDAGQNTYDDGRSKHLAAERQEHGVVNLLHGHHEVVAADGVAAFVV